MHMKNQDTALKPRASGRIASINEKPSDNICAPGRVIGGENRAALPNDGAICAEPTVFYSFSIAHTANIAYNKKEFMYPFLTQPGAGRRGTGE